MSIRRHVAALMAAGLAAFGPAAPAAALEIGYRQQSHSMDLGTEPRNTFNNKQSDATFFAGAPHRQPFSVSVPLRMFTLADESGVLAMALQGGGRAYNARQDAMRDAAARGAKPGEKITYTVENPRFQAGIGAFVNYGWGSSTGAKVTPAGGGAATEVVTQNDMWLLEAGYYTPLVVKSNWDLMLAMSVIASELDVKGGLTYKEWQIMAPFRLIGAYIPLSMVRIRPSVGYDPLFGLLALLPVHTTTPAQGFTYGLDLEVQPLPFLRGTVGYQATRGNIDVTRPLATGATHFGVSLVF